MLIFENLPWVEIMYSVLGMACLICAGMFIQRAGFLIYMALIILGSVCTWTSKNKAVERAYNKGRLEAFEIINKIKNSIEARDHELD